MVLTAKQQTFIDKYVKGGFFHRKSDAKKTDRFEEFLKLEQDTQAIIDQLTDETPDIDSAEQALDAARVHKDAGEFKAAVAGAQQALVLAKGVEAKVTARRSRRTDLQDDLAGNANNPLGATAAEITDLDAKRRVVSDALADNLPSDGNFATAKAGLTTLSDAIADVAAAAAGRASDKKQLNDGQAKEAARLVTLRVQLARITGDSEHGRIDTLATGIDTDLTAMATAVAANDPAAITTGLADLQGIPARLDTLETEIDTVLSNILKATLSSTGTSDEEKAALVKLGKANPDALTAATAVLTTIQGSLGDVDVDRADLEARANAVTQAQALVDTKSADLKIARDARDLAKASEKSKYDEILDIQNDQGALEKQVKEFVTAHRAILKDNSHPDHTTRVAEYRTLKASLTAKTLEFDAKFEAYQPIKATADSTAANVVTSKADLTQARTDLDERKAEERKAGSKKRLLDSLSFGPLAPDNGRPVPPAIAKDLVVLYGRDPKIADMACDVARSAQHPDSVAATAALMCDKTADKFKSDTGNSFANQSYCDSYAENLVKMSANLPPAEAGKIDDYIKDGRHFVNTPEIDALKSGSTSERGKKRTEYVGKALLNDDGTLDLDKGRDAMQDLMFHPRVVRRETPGQVIHMLETVEFLDGSAQAQTLLANAGPPTSDSAKSLLALSSGKDAGNVDEKETRGAILNAMLTPVRQGSVGSCFATAGIVKRRNDDPFAAMQDYKKLATDGVFEPKNGDDAIPAVTKFAAGDDPLVRSLEYSAATAVARADFSRLGKGFDDSVTNMVDGITTKIKSSKRADVTARLENAIKAAVEIVYDPTVETVDADDGSSTHGKYQLISTKDGSVISDLDKYEDLVFDIIVKEVRNRDTKVFTSPQDVGDQVTKRDFANAIKIGGKFPWDLPSGGDAQEANQVILGGDITLTPLTTNVDPAGADVPARTKEVLSTVMTAMAPSDDPPDPNEMRSCGTRGMHDFNVLPGHKSLAPLREGGPDALAANIESNLVGPADTLSKADIPLDQLTYMFEREVAELARTAKDADKSEVDTILRTKTPTDAMTPPAFKQYMKATTGAYFAAKSDRDSATWAASQSCAPTPEKLAKNKSDRKERLEKGLSNSMTDNLVKDLGAPEFVIADTNWGSAKSSSFFVIIGDPTTGEPALFIKDEPPGTLRAISDAAKWVSTEWQDIK